MHRIDTATKLVDANGSGKDGFTDGSPGVTAPTDMNASFFNSVQEEIALTIEASGRTLSASNSQLSESVVLLDTHNTTFVTGDATATQAAITGRSTGANRGGVKGISHGSGNGVEGVGGSSGGLGVKGSGGLGDGTGVYGIGDSIGNGIGVWGDGTGTAVGGYFDGAGNGTGASDDAAELAQNLRLSGSNPASSTGFTNRLTKMNIPKAWGTVTGAGASAPTVTAGFNVTASRVANDTLQITFGANMANANYAVITNDDITTWGQKLVVFSRTSSGFQVQYIDSANITQTTSGRKFYFVVYGQQ